MNLTTEPWIPVVRADGLPASVSLSEVFEQGETIRDLVGRPHERIAMMRLLVCIAQAALDGPDDQAHWKACFPKIVPAALEYLKRWCGAFELLGNGQRFLQVDKLEKLARKSSEKVVQATSISKLDLALATGSNPTLFDNAGGSERAFSPSELAMALLTFQCFSPGGLIGVACWNGQETKGKGTSSHAPCLAGGMLHALLRGSNLLHTLHRNLLTKQRAEQFFGNDSWGRPVWELMPAGPSDAAAIRNATTTYLGRLVPLCRAIRLADDARSLILANGLEYPSYHDTGWREPTATVVARTLQGQPAHMLLSASTDKVLWRELHALTVKAMGQNSSGPAALQNLSDEQAFDLWVGGLVANKARLVDTIESVFHVPAAMLAETSQKIYEQGVCFAEKMGRRLMRALSIYHTELGDDLDRPEMKNRRLQIQNNAAAHFWTKAESALPCLFGMAENPGKPELIHPWQNTDWGKAVWSAMYTAYERACPCATSRQMRAYALGLNALSAGPAVPTAPEPEARAVK